MHDRKILVLNFDGVIHKYDQPWQGADVIPDGPVPDAMQFIHDALKEFRVAIFSSRGALPEGIDAMRVWLHKHMVHELGELTTEYTFTAIEWPTEKPAAMVTIDDRAITFLGTWPSIASLKSFKPWNKR